MVVFIHGDVANFEMADGSMVDQSNMPLDLNDNRHNAATSGVPSEVGAEELVIPKRKSEYNTTLQSPGDLSPSKCGSEMAQSRRLVKFGGCDAPRNCIPYIDGRGYVYLRQSCMPGNLRQARFCIKTICG